ncbi:hypothetical protein HZB00_01650, partial [Candidatus Woesearchaeota archaeon]|nr:hypothetical protein [Candidatus Woesearchaeota archaeon]
MELEVYLRQEGIEDHRDRRLDAIIAKCLTPDEKRAFDYLAERFDDQNIQRNIAAFYEFMMDSARFSAFESGL